jgi:hypothetical protein
MQLNFDLFVFQNSKLFGYDFVLFIEKKSAMLSNLFTLEHKL